MNAFQFQSGWEEEYTFFFELERNLTKEKSPEKIKRVIERPDQKLELNEHGNQKKLIETKEQRFLQHSSINQYDNNEHFEKRK